MSTPANAINLNATAYGVVSFDGIKVFNTIVPSTSGNVLTSNGTTWISSPVSSSGAVTTLTGNSGGAISPTAGNINTVGTGSITIVGSGSTLTTQLTGLTNHSLLVGAGTSTITNLGVATNGQIPIGSTGANPVLATITQGANITVTNGAGSITLAVPTAAGLSLAAFGSTPNANGLTLTSGVLNMQPADGTNPGGVSTTTQNWAGNKIFNTSATSASFLVASGGGGLANIQYPSSAANYNFNLPTSAGTTGYFLTSGGGGSTNNTWTSPAAAGASLVLIQSQTVSNAASAVFTTGLTSYNMILVTITNLITVTGNPNVNMDFSSNGGSTYINSGLVCGIATHTYTSTTLSNTNSTATAPIGITVLGNSVYSGEIWIRGLNNGSATISYDGTATWYDGSNYQFGDIFGTTSGNVGINALRFSAASGNISGTITIYGLSTS